MFEEGNTLVLEFELPGVPKDDINLNIEEDILTLTSTKPKTQEERKGYYYNV
jgi:HSP20 family molecular chaperone IbpA